MMTVVMVDSHLLLGLWITHNSTWDVGGPSGGQDGGNSRWTVHNVHHWIHYTTGHRSGCHLGAHTQHWSWWEVTVTLICSYHWPHVALRPLWKHTTSTKLTNVHSSTGRLWQSGTYIRSHCMHGQQQGIEGDWPRVRFFIHGMRVC